MTDYEVMIDLLDKNGMFQLAGTAIWLTVGHVEFDENGKITNIVNY